MIMGGISLYSIFLIFSLSILKLLLQRSYFLPLQVYLFLSFNFFGGYCEQDRFSDFFFHMFVIDKYECYWVCMLTLYLAFLPNDFISSKHFGIVFRVSEIQNHITCKQDTLLFLFISLLLPSLVFLLQLRHQELSQK